MTESGNWQHPAGYVARIDRDANTEADLDDAIEAAVAARQAYDDARQVNASSAAGAARSAVVASALIRACHAMTTATAVLVDVSHDKAVLVDDIVRANKGMNEAMAAVDRIVDEIQDGVRVMDDEALAGVDLAYRDWPRREELGSVVQPLQKALDGMDITRREVAAMAMQGILAANKEFPAGINDKNSSAYVARNSISYADALFDALLEKNGTK